jgi:adenosylhomocysteine nucleosidase
MTGIIGAMPEELDALLELLEEVQERRHGAFTLYQGTLVGKPVLMALCGIGKVNAAALTQLMLMQGVTHVVFTGVAGAVDPSLEVGDIVISTDALQHDLDVTALGYALGQVPGEVLSWAADPALRNLAMQAAAVLTDVNVVTGRIVSGDQFIASVDKVAWLHQTFGASCAEMEGASVAQVCAKAGVPFVIIRSMSDTADHDASISFREFTPLAANRAKQLVRHMLELL